MSIGKTIQKIRFLNGITQGDLAEAVGTTQQTISTIEHNSHKAKVSSIARIADALNSTLIDLCIDLDELQGSTRYLQGKNMRQSELLTEFNKLNIDGQIAAIECLKKMTEQIEYNEDLKRKIEAAKELINKYENKD